MSSSLPSILLCVALFGEYIMMHTSKCLGIRNPLTTVDVTSTSSVLYGTDDVDVTSKVVKGFTSLYLVIGEFCYKELGYLNFESLNCPFGCCGDWLHRHCCVTDIGKLVGIIIGSLIGLAVIIGVSVTIYICVKKHKKHKGRVINPAVVGVNTVGGYSNQTSSWSGAYPPNPYGTAYGGFAPATYGNPYGNYPPPPSYGDAYGGVEAPYPPLMSQPPLGAQTNYGVDPFGTYNK